MGKTFKEWCIEPMGWTQMASIVGIGAIALTILISLAIKKGDERDNHVWRIDCADAYYIVSHLEVYQGYIKFRMNDKEWIVYKKCTMSRELDGQVVLNEVEQALESFEIIESVGETL